jgi:hypothetical protein
MSRLPLYRHMAAKKPLLEADPDAYVERPAYPRKVRVGPFDWTVKSWDSRAAGNSAAYGMCDTGTLTILVQEGLTLQWEQHVLIHELFHAMHSTGAVRELTPNRDLEEGTVAIFAFQLLGLMRDNPELMAYLLHRE